MTRCVILALTCATPALADGPRVQTDHYGTRAIETVVTTDVFAAPVDSFDGQSSPTPRGAPNWIALGPFGGDVQDVVLAPIAAPLMFAGTAPQGSFGGALYRSTNFGATWTRVSQLSTISVWDIECLPNGTCWAAGQDGLWRSTDQGVTWTRFTLGLGNNRQILEVTIDPGNPSTLWVGVADAGGAQTMNVMRSIDNGTTWMNVTPPLAAPQSCRGIAIDPANSNNVYACFAGAFGGGQVWVTENGTATPPTWTNRSAGLPNNPMNAIAHDGARVLVCGGQLFGGQNVGVYASSNQGMTWEPLHDGSWPSLAINDIRVDPTNSSTLYAGAARSGVFRSTNGGADWEFSIGGTNELTINAVRVAPGNPTWLLAGASSQAVFQSMDGGQNFASTSTGINELNIFSAAVNPHLPGEMAVAFQGANDGGVYTSLDGGQTWTLEDTPATRWDGTYFNFDGTLYAISTGPSTVAPEGVYRRNPATGIWVGLGPDQGTLFESELFVIRGSRTNPDLLLAGGNDFGVAGFQPTIWRSTNAGGDWDKVYEGVKVSESITDIQIIEDGTDMTMLASFRDLGEVQDGGVLRSTNGGVDWEPSSTGLPPLAHGAALGPSPADINTFYLANRDFTAGQGGVWRSTNGGQNWSNTGYTPPVSDIACDEHDERTLYIAVPAATRVLRSQNSGASFQPFNTNLPTGINVNDLVYAGGVSPQLLAATSRGVYATSLSDPCGGDLNFDRSVGLSDLTILLSNFDRASGALYAHGDMTGDGDVDLGDLTEFLAAFGTTCP